MSDEKSWQAPSSGRSAKNASPWAAPESAEPAAETASGDWRAQPPPAVWAPPPKPGLIPLRPLGFGTIIGSSFRLIRRNPGPTFGLAAALYGIITLGFSAAAVAFIAATSNRVSSAVGDDQAAIAAGSFAFFAFLLVAPVGLIVIASGVLQGVLSLEVSRATLGEKLTIRGLWRLAKGRIGALVGWSLVVSAAAILFVVAASIVTVVVSTALTLGLATGVTNDVESSMAAGMGIVLGIMLLMVVVGSVFVALSAWLGTKTALVPSLLVLERLPFGAALARSWRLTKGFFWRTLGSQLLIAVMVNVASSIITFPVYIIVLILASLVDPFGEPGGEQVALAIVAIVTAFLLVIVGAVGLVMQSSALTLVYIDIRMRKEGLDLELLHFVESKRTGDAGVTNPYLRDTRATKAQPSPAGDSPWG